MKRFIGENLAKDMSVQNQVDLISWLSTGDPGVMSDTWQGRDLPDAITEQHRAALTALVAQAHPSVQPQLGSIIARWSGALKKTTTVAAGPKLSPEEMKRFASGRERYMTLCIACHQPTGQGLPGLAPSLVKSEWVEGPASRPARIVMHGLQGPITVNGQLFNSPVIMPPQKDVLDDVAIAEILTYVRNEWGNVATPVQEADIKAIREAESARSAPWTAEELLKLK